MERFPNSIPSPEKGEGSSNNAEQNNSRLRTALEIALEDGAVSERRERESVQKNRWTEEFPGKKKEEGDMSGVYDKLKKDKEIVEAQLEEAIKQDKNEEKVFRLEGRLRAIKSHQSFYDRERVISVLDENEGEYLKKLEQYKKEGNEKEIANSEEALRAIKDARTFAEEIQRQKNEHTRVGEKIFKLLSEKSDLSKVERLIAHEEQLEELLYDLEDREVEMLTRRTEETSTEDHKEEESESVPVEESKVEDEPVVEDAESIPDSIASSIYATDLYREAMRRSAERGEKEEVPKADSSGSEEQDVDKESKKEKVESSESVPDLERARETFARSEIALGREGLKGKRVENVDRAEEAAIAENIYRTALKKERQELLSALEGEEGKDKKLKEILVKTTALEAMDLYNLKTEIVSQERPTGFSEKVFKKVQGVERWYRGLRPRNKILIAGGLLATGGVGAALGGVIGAGMVGTALTAKTLQRVLAGAGVGVGLEQMMKSAESARINRAMEKAFGSKGAEEIMLRFERGNSALDEALLKLESEQGRRKVRRYVIAATGGGLLASSSLTSSAFEYIGEQAGGISEIIREKFGWVPNSEDMHYGGADPSGAGGTPLDIRGGSSFGEMQPDTGQEILKGGVSLPGAEVLPSLESYEVQPGDNMYSILEKSFPEIADLEGYPQANAIENILAVIKEDPARFGVESGDVNVLSVGDRIDIEKINELLETERVEGQSIADRAQSLASSVRSETINSLDGSVFVESASEGLTSAESMKELREFFRQTPGYLTRTVALEEFLEMIERGDIDAETLRSFEESSVGDLENTLPGRYEYEFEVLKQGESVFGSDEYGKVEQKLGRVFDNLWGGAPDVESSSDVALSGLESYEAPSPGEGIGTLESEIEGASEVNHDSIESLLTPEQVHQKLDSLFSSANSNITHSETVEGGGSWSQSLEGTIESSDYLQMSESFRSFLSMINSGELSAEEFARYVSEGRGADDLSRTHPYVHEFGLIRDPMSYKLSSQEVEVARRRLESVFRALWLEKSQ